MDHQARCAFIIAQAACAQARIAAMQAENQHQMSIDGSIRYGEEAFNNIEREYMIGHNDVIGYLCD